MTKREKARHILTNWMIRADPHIIPQVPKSFMDDLDNYERTVRDEEDEQVAKDVYDKLGNMGLPGADCCDEAVRIAGDVCDKAIRARIAARKKGTDNGQ